MWFASMNLVQVKYIVLGVLQVDSNVETSRMKLDVLGLVSRFLLISAPPTGFSLPFQQQLLSSFPGTSPVGQHFCLYRLRPTR